jgi:hypothetical protein
MHIFIFVPVGVRRVAAVQGAVWKLVSCAHCHERYAYLLNLDATGEDHDLLFLDAQGSAQRARAQAEQNFLQKSRKVVLPVPCPSCGSYQDDMARILKEDASINPFQIAGAVIAALSLVPLALSIPYIWILTIVLALTGLALLAWGYLLAFRFNANAGDPERRKAIGRSRAVWGEQLNELLAKSAPTEVQDTTQDTVQSAAITCTPRAETRALGDISGAQ